jgi:hypothetical protein
MSSHLNPETLIVLVEKHHAGDTIRMQEHWQESTPQDMAPEQTPNENFI